MGPCGSILAVHQAGMNIINILTGRLYRFLFVCVTITQWIILLPSTGHEQQQDPSEHLIKKPQFFHRIFHIFFSYRISNEDRKNITKMGIMKHKIKFLIFHKIISFVLI